MSRSGPLVRCTGATRTYGEGAIAQVALTPTDCEVWPGQRIALVGRSGSGKSTLLHLLAGLDSPTLGEVEWPAIGGLAELRPGPVAVVFQGPSLLAALSAIENAALPALLAGEAPRRAQARALELFEQLGLSKIAEKLPEQISGGQAQRVAVARALLGRPRLILADEPTGQIDHEMASLVIDQLLGAVEDSGAALVVATHDAEIADRLDQRWEMSSGDLHSRALTGGVAA